MDRAEDHSPGDPPREAREVARLPYVISANSTKGMSRAGWFVVVLAVLLLIVVALVEEFLL